LQHAVYLGHDQSGSGARTLAVDDVNLYWPAQGPAIRSMPKQPSP
jgi:hypothetical protein